MNRTISTKQTRLAVSRTTLRALSPRDLREVRGGWTDSRTLERLTVTREGDVLEENP